MYCTNGAISEESQWTRFIRSEKDSAPGVSQTPSNLRASHPLLLSVPFVVSKIASSAVLHEKKGIQRIRAGIPFLRFAN